MRTTVAIIGAGPTGLLAAAELALRGVEVTVLERLDAPDPTIKSGSINVASAEILDRRGLLPAAESVQRRLLESVGSFMGGKRGLVRDVAEAAKTSGPRFPVAGHFAGMLFRPNLVDQNDPLLLSHSAVANGVLVPQHELESILADRCRSLGVEVRRGIEVQSLLRGGGLEDDEAVLQTSAGTVTASWVIAADGGRSAVRKALAIEFAGTDSAMVGYQAVADIDGADALKPGWTWTPHGIYAFGPIPGRILVAKFGSPPADRNVPVTAAELEAVAREVTQEPIVINALHGRATR